MHIYTRVRARARALSLFSPLRENHLERKLRAVLRAEEIDMLRCPVTLRKLDLINFIKNRAPRNK